MSLKKLSSYLFHRAAVVAVLLLIQIFLLITVILRFSDYFVQFYLVCMLLSVLATLYLVGSQNDPGYKIAWIVPILLAPVFGGMIYLLMGGQRLTRGVRRQMEGMGRRMEEVLAPDYKAEELEPFGSDAVNQARYLERCGHCPVYGNTWTQYYPLGDDMFKPLLRALRNAKEYIFLEYFIITPGKFWNAVLDILEEKAAQGVDVRILYDDVGCLYTLPGNYDAQLRAKGIQCQVFNRFKPVLSLRLNNRDHRKLCIVDGHTAFTGGVNLADEYINEIDRFGHWKDTALQVKGEGAWSMTVMFLTMWESVTGKRESLGKYRPKGLPTEAHLATGWVQPYTDSPLDEEAVGETVYLNLISKAGEYVYLMTPYLIISDRMNAALCNAAKSGVDVRILTPHIPDKKIVFEVTRAHYAPLLRAGVKIYEYTPGFLHAKCFAVDDRYAVVGTVNMDYRSMFLHFENGVWMCGDETVLEVRRDFLATQRVSQEMTLETENRSWGRRLLRSVLRLFAPLL